MPLSSNRSSSIPVSFDRFRMRSIQFLPPYFSHQYEKQMKQSPERSWIRKFQVHPHQNNSSEQIDHDTEFFFHANKRSNTKTIPLLENPPTKKCSHHFFNKRPASNVIGVLDFCKLPVTNASRPSQPQVPGCSLPPTPYIIHYRKNSPSTVIPTRIGKHPKSSDDATKQSELDQIDQLNV